MAEEYEKEFLAEKYRRKREIYEQSTIRLQQRALVVVPKNAQKLQVSLSRLVKLLYPNLAVSFHLDTRVMTIVARTMNSVVVANNNTGHKPKWWNFPILFVESEPIAPAKAAKANGAYTEEVNKRVKYIASSKLPSWHDVASVQLLHIGCEGKTFYVPAYDLTEGIYCPVCFCEEDAERINDARMHIYGTLIRAKYQSIPETTVSSP